MDNFPDKKTYIIIVAYNGMQWLDKCLKSTTPYPTIVVDNASTDGTVEFIKSKFPDVVIIEQKENLGFGRANNIGMSFALQRQAEYVFLLNQDAFLGPTTLTKLIKISLDNPSYGIISPIHLNGKGTALEKVFSYYMHKDNENELLSDFLTDKKVRTIYQVPMVNAAAWLITRQVLETVGGFQPLFFLYGEDDNYAQRVYYHGFKIGVCPGVYVKHDSNSFYHLYPEKGTKKYYAKFLNRIKIDYADVNTNNYLKIKDLRRFYIKKAMASLIQMDIKTFKINSTKQSILKRLDFTEDVTRDRKKYPNYLS